MESILTEAQIREFLANLEEFAATLSHSERDFLTLILARARNAKGGVETAQNTDSGGAIRHELAFGIWQSMTSELEVFGVNPLPLQSIDRTVPQENPIACLDMNTHAVEEK